MLTQLLNNKNLCLLSLFLALLIQVSLLPINAAQHPIVQKIISQYPSCKADYFFSDLEINSKSHNVIYQKQLQILAKDIKHKRPQPLRASQVKELNLIPVNDCILRGNRNYVTVENQKLLNDMSVKTTITTDALVDKKYGNLVKLDYKFFPITPKKYPAGQSLTSIMQALDLMAEAKPNQKCYISCYFGKHRTGLIVGLYQFLRMYAAEPHETCAKLATSLDKVYMQMNSIASLGALTYDMPPSYMKFYKDFGQSVCNERSKEFVELVSNK
jgi:hypothetical protein